MEDNNVEVMENVTITDLDDVKEDSTLVKVAGTATGVLALYGLGNLIVKGYKIIRYEAVPKGKAWIDSKRKKPEEKTSEHEGSAEKAETKADAKESKKEKSKK